MLLPVFEGFDEVVLEENGTFSPGIVAIWKIVGRCSSLRTGDCQSWGENLSYILRKSHCIFPPFYVLSRLRWLRWWFLQSLVHHLHTRMLALCLLIASRWYLLSRTGFHQKRICFLWVGLDGIVSVRMRFEFEDQMTSPWGQHGLVQGVGNMLRLFHDNWVASRGHLLVGPVRGQHRWGFRGIHQE